MKEFGEDAIPKIGWYVDSFGHSKTNQRLLHELGMEAMFAARDSAQDKATRRQNKELEFWWDLGDNGMIFSHFFPDFYAQPGSFEMEPYNE